MQLHLVSGFLGSGKTTAIQTACVTLIDEGRAVGVITNDQGIRLVDTEYFESIGISNRQVINGCFCCNYAALDENIQSLIQADNPDIIFAESVGSCTDIVATVMKPLLLFNSGIDVTISTFADAQLLYMLLIEKRNLLNEPVEYIYTKQLEEAGTIVISKIDLIAEEKFNAIQNFLQQQYPGKNIIAINGREKSSVTSWLNFISPLVQRCIPASLNIDYNLYGTGEAMLAWLDTVLQISAVKDDAPSIARLLAQTVYKKIKDEGYTIGHLKFLIDASIKLSYTAAEQNLIATSDEINTTSSVVVNARVQTSPEVLKQIVDTAIEEIQREKNCTIIKESYTAFQPGFPSPAHRFVD
ncbi:MAG: hypothetical protein JST21_12635 [Bacteroidetes bacterium]|nr:hypothetical protein [Bacteroidota bacterium]